MVGNGGYIKLYRKIRKDWQWPNGKPYSRIEAWTDLIMEAAYEDTKRLVDGKLFHLRRGQLIASIRYLAKRWSWGRHKTLAYLDKLQTDGKIVRKTGQGMGQITICKYNTYNPKRDTKGDSEGTARGQI